MQRGKEIIMKIIFHENIKKIKNRSKNLFRYKGYSNGLDVLLYLFFSLLALFGILLIIVNQKTGYFMFFGSAAFIYALLIKTKNLVRTFNCVGALALLAGYMTYFIGFWLVGWLITISKENIEISNNEKPYEKNKLKQDTRNKSTKIKPSYNKVNIKQDNIKNLLQYYDDPLDNNRGFIEEEKEKEMDETKYKNLIKLIENTQSKSMVDVENKIYMDTKNFELFKRFIANTKESLDIATNRISLEVLIELIAPIIQKDITIRIITRIFSEQSYFKNIKNKYNLNIEYKKCSNFHAKFIIRDKEKMLLGSSNIKKTSMESFYEANVVTTNKKSVNEATEVFDALWNQKELINRTQNNFIYSKYDESSPNLYLPKKIEQLVSNEENKVIVLMCHGLMDKAVLDKLRAINKNIKIEINTGQDWSTTMTEENIATFKYIRSITDEIKFIPREINIHAKVYIFKSQGVVLISSQNLTIDSWTKQFETGFIIRDKDILNNLTKEITELKEGKFVPLDKLKNIGKPKSTWHISKDETRIKIPWKMPVDDPENTLIKMKSETFFSRRDNKIKDDTKHEYYSYSKESADDIIREIIKQRKYDRLKNKRMPHGSKEDIYKEIKTSEDLLEEIQYIDPDHCEVKELERAIIFLRKRLEKEK